MTRLNWLIVPEMRPKMVTTVLLRYVTPDGKRVTLESSVASVNLQLNSTMVGQLVPLKSDCTNSFVS